MRPLASSNLLENERLRVVKVTMNSKQHMFIITSSYAFFHTPHLVNFWSAYYRCVLCFCMYCAMVVKMLHSKCIHEIEITKCIAFGALEETKGKESRPFRDKRNTQQKRVEVRFARKIPNYILFSNKNLCSLTFSHCIRISMGAGLWLCADSLNRCKIAVSLTGR